MKLNPIMSIFALSAFSTLSVADTLNTNDLSQYINPMIGTDAHPGFSHGNKLPFVAVPMPMTLISPQMQTDSSTKNGPGWFYTYWNCTKEDRDIANCQQKERLITGFRFSHEPSPWINDYGYFSFMPVLYSSNIGEDSSPGTPNAEFTHSNEESHPYLYKVKFDNQLTTKITASRRAGMIEFQSPEDKTRIVLDLQGYGGFSWDKDNLNFYGNTSNNSGGAPSGFKNNFAIQFYQHKGLANTAISPSEIKVWNGSTLQNATFDEATQTYNVPSGSLKIG